MKNVGKHFKHTKLILGMLLCGLFFGNIQAQIQVDSVKATVSSCPNNGTIAVYAKSSSLPVLYSIVSGPSLQAEQTGNVFNSLLPGSYTVKITDGSGASVLRNTIVTGTYKALDFKPTTTAPKCVGNSNGSITGNIVVNTGKAPYTWQLIAPSPVTAPAQSSDKFMNLPSGNYTVRLTDACGSFRTIVATVEVPNTKISFYGTIITVKIGCDTMYVRYGIQNAFNQPLQFKYETKNGSTVTTHPTQLDTTNKEGYVYVEQAIPNLTYGDDLKITVYNTCGDSSSLKRTIAPYTFYPKYAYDNCGNIVTPSFYNVPDANYFDGLKVPLTYSFTDVSTNTIVDNGTIAAMPGNKLDQYVFGIAIKPVSVGKTYQLMIKDGCGKVFQQNYTIPAQSIPKITQRSISSKACIDSVTGTYGIGTTGFSNPVLILLSGPTKLGSTKPGYAYTDTYSYPDTIGQAYSNNFEIGNLAIGTYKFKIIDDCGKELYDQIIIYPENVTDLGTSVSYKKGCLGQNKIYYSLPGGFAAGGGTITVKALATGIVLKTSKIGSYNAYKNDSLINVPSGKYVVTFQFSTDPPYSTPHNDTNIPCWVVNDTITIEEYASPEVSTSNAVACHDKINVVLVPDSSKGVPPYQYEIVSGPETFPVQNKNIFTLSKPGIYTARIFDVCGNATAKQIAIDSLALVFAPISITKSCARIRYLYQASPYYSYKWTRPDHSTFVNNVLDLNPITPHDTGTYQVMKTININGCKDTLYASYHISLSNINMLDTTICNGSAVQIGAHWYQHTGVYTDTLVSTNGCDSIVKLTLQVINYHYGSQSMSICPGQSATIGGRLYTQPGSYADTIATAGCDSIIVTQLSYYPMPSIDLGKDTAFCKGQTMKLNAGAGYSAYYWNSNSNDSTSYIFPVDQKGKYWVMVKNQYGCTSSDTIRIGDLYPLPVADAGAGKQSCAGTQVQLTASGGDSYRWIPTGDTQPSLLVAPLVSTTYTVVVGDKYKCGTDTSRVTVDVHPFPQAPFENNSLVHCFQDSTLTLDARADGTFLWTASGETTKTIIVKEKGIYEVSITNEWGCKTTGSIKVVEYCEPKLFVPEAFSPNGDGQNDALEIFGKNFTNFKITIFNRWGEIIFISTDKNLLWDGNYRGEEMQIGNYPWVLSYENSFDPAHALKTVKGSVTLLR